MKFSSRIIFLICLPVVCFAQNTNLVFDEYNFDNGLSANQVSCIVQDEDDFLWIGTHEGLNRFDGNSFTKYFKLNNGLADSHINDLCVLPNHKLAIATISGLNFLDTHTGIFTTFQIKDTTTLSVFRNSFTKLCLDKNGNLWAGTLTDLLIFNHELKLIHSVHISYGKSDIDQKTIDGISGIYLLPDGEMLLDENDQFVIYNSKTFQSKKLLKHPESPFSFITKAACFDLSRADAGGEVWFMLPGKDSIFSYNTLNKSAKAFPLFKNASSHFNWFSRSFFYNENKALLVLSDVGFFQLTITGASMLITHIDNLPAVNNVAVFFYDHQNNLWIGSANGLYEVSTLKNQFHSISLSATENQATQAESACFFKHNDELWVGTYGNGIYNYNLKTKFLQHFVFQLPGALYLNEIWNINKHNRDTLWIGTQQGLLWFIPSQKKYGRLQFSHPGILDSFPVTTQFEDSRGYVWIGVGVGRGLVCYDPSKNSFVVYNAYSSPALPLRHPTAIAEDENGNLWMGTQRGGGIVECNKISKQFKVVNPATTSIPDQVNSIFADHRGNLWLGTYFGLVQYNIRKNTFKQLGKEQGLSNEKIESVDGSQFPFLWITTALGFNRFNTLTNKFESFYKTDGLPSDVMNGGIYYDSTTHTMYAGYPNGVLQFNPTNFLINKRTPSVFINALIINDSLSHTDLTKPVSFNYKQDNITVWFTAVDLVNGSDLNFRYRLNNESNWSNADKSRAIHFSNLSPGKYLLQIEAANKSGEWNTNATQLAFSISSPFWSTWWFYAVVAIIFILIVYALYRFRIRQLQKVQNMRNRIAQDLHDDIGGTITAINLINELAMQRLHKPDAAKKLLTDISEDLKNAGETLDDIVWTVNPKNDSMAEVMARMRRYASHTWEAKGIDFNFDFNKDAENIHLNMEQRHDLYLVFKEAVNNVAKHAQCTQAFSSVLVTGHSLLVEIKDNGKGFDVNAPSHRNGIKNMQSRIQKWKGEFNIHSSCEKGTCIRLHMPITQKSD